MRLIDVSVLKEWVENWFTKNRFYHPYAKNNNIPITELYDILEQMPTIEERKGKWIPYLSNGLTVMCSKCGSRFDRPWHYCPNCGAKMEGEQNVCNQK